MVALILDTETTGHNEPEVIEVGYVQINLDSGKPLSGPLTFECRYKPTKPSLLGALKVHHILDEELEECEPTGSFQLPEGTEYLIGQNIDYDWAAIGKPDVRRICTLALARTYYPELDSHSQVSLVYHFAKDRREARERIRNAHSALPDVLMCLGNLQHMTQDRLPKYGSWEELWRLSEAARVPKVMPFGKHRGERIARVPGDYKRWLLRQPDVDPYLRRALEGVA